MREDHKTTNQLVSQAIQCWIDLTGYSREQRVHRIGREVFGGLGSLDIKRHTEELCASRELDPTGLTTFMMLRGLVEHCLRNENFSAHDLILAPERVEGRLVPMRAVRDLLEHEDVVAIVDSFSDKLREAAKHYGWVGPRAQKPDVDTAQHNSLEALLADKFDLAYLRRDALRSLDTLEAHQFTQGAGDPDPPGIGPHVWEFWNMNSVLRAMRAQRVPGVNVVLLRDPEEALRSTFVVAFRNGDNITVLTDRTESPHPLAKYMSRRPDRDLSERAARHWFPYHLLDLKVTEDQKGLYASARTGLVPANAEGVKLAPITELGASCFVWLVLLADLVRERYWKANHHVPELSYTGEMVRVPEALVGSTSALVASGNYTPLDLPPVTSDDLTPEVLVADGGRAPTGIHRWLTERYVDQVPETALSPVGEAEAKLLGAGVPKPRRDSFLMRHEERKPVLRALEPTSFGTAESIRKDRTWLARYNQAKYVNALAREEFDREREAVVAAYKELVLKNADLVLRAAAEGTLTLPSARDKGGFDEALTRGPLEALAWSVGSGWYDAFDKSDAVASGTYVHGLIVSEKHDGDVILGEWVGGKWRCHDRPDTVASVFTIVVPTCPEALAVLAGVPVEELPWPLRHWYRDEPDTGNSILDRVDPEEWVVEDPWRKLKLRVGVTSCRGAVNERRKKMGLSRRDWP